MKRLIEELTEGHLESRGGYPFDWKEHAGKVFIASLSHDDATRIHVYDVKALEQWEVRATEFERENPDEEWGVCVWETQDDCKPED